jgi:hypothetical protein
MLCGLYKAARRFYDVDYFAGKLNRKDRDSLVKRSSLWQRIRLPLGASLRGLRPSSSSRHATDTNFGQLLHGVQSLVDEHAQQYQQQHT